MIDIKEIIKPENELEIKLINDKDFINGFLYGKPRNGHPEGEVIHHIGHVLSNIDKISEGTERMELRLIAIIHDTFKYKVDRTQPKFGENHHTMIARRYAEKYINDEKLLDIIELHDEAYLSWCKGNRNDDWGKADYRVNNLIKRLGNNINLYLKFYQCDNETGDKEAHCFTWFKNKIK